MPDAPLKPQPVPISIGGRECRLSYGMHAVVLYQRETARIESGRPHPEDPDPRCVCGWRKSQHVGPNLIRLGDKQELLCSRFRPEDPLLGDSLFLFESWLKIDLNLDPERWLACLWCGLHERQANGKWTVPFATLEDLGAELGISGDTRALTDKMFEALVAWMPKAKPEKVPNATAPGEPAPAESSPTSSNSGDARATDGASPSTSS